MSKKCSCVYYDNGKCKKFSDNEVTSWCIEGPCKDKTPSNADRIRAMSDEELTTFMECFGCGHYCSEQERLGNEASFFQGEKCDEKCEQHILEWLKQPAETPTTNADRCVSCGAIIPEGTMVCTNCNGEKEG